MWSNVSVKYLITERSVSHHKQFDKALSICFKCVAFSVFNIKVIQRTEAYSMCDGFGYDHKENEKHKRLKMYLRYSMKLLYN